MYCIDKLLNLLVWVNELVFLSVYLVLVYTAKIGTLEVENWLNFFSTTKYPTIAKFIYIYL